MVNYLELAQRVSTAAAANGVEAEAIITHDTSTIIAVNKGEVDQLSQSSSRGLGVRVIDGGRTGYAYTSDFSDSSIEQTWRTALDLAKVATADEYRALPQPSSVINNAELDIWDSTLADIPMTEKIDFLKRVEQAALNYDPRVILVDFCTYEDSISNVYLANSRGFAGEYGRTTVASYLAGVARGEDGGMTNAFGMGASNFFRDMNADEIGSEAGQKAVSILGGQPVPTQTASVVLDHFVGAQILSTLAAALSAQAWQRKRSFLMGKMGQTVANDIVTLMDNGQLKGGLASAPFDGEGVPTSATRLIDEGVLQNLIYDSYAARRDGVKSTGNAQRNGHRSLPTLGPSNFYMQPGHISREEIIAGVKKGLYVISVMQTGGIDPITGDCSMGANGLWIEDGKFVGPVGGVTIATTLNDLLNNITQVGNDLRVLPFFGAIGVPTLRVDNVIIGGTN
ncbi:MAG: TldD/PmbA family protein [Anaerolineae bacterium]|nr:TldD/PmbA family protein [Anaerolineae bacterium]